MQAQRRIRLGRRLGGNARLLAICDHLLAVDGSSRVLTADDVMRSDRLYGLQHLHLLVADRLGVKGQRGVHRNQREHLEHVVLDDVTNRADLLVQLAALFDAERLGNSDLHSRYGFATPDPLEE